MGLHLCVVECVKCSAVGFDAAKRWTYISTRTKTHTLYAITTDKFMMTVAALVNVQCTITEYAPRVKNVPNVDTRTHTNAHDKKHQPLLPRRGVNLSIHPAVFWNRKSTREKVKSKGKRKSKNVRRAGVAVHRGS